MNVYRECGRLAMQFRGTRDEAERKKIAELYAEAFHWEFNEKEIPGPEEELPDEFMPPEWFDFLKRLK